MSFSVTLASWAPWIRVAGLSLPGHVEKRRRRRVSAVKAVCLLSRGCHMAG